MKLQRQSVRVKEESHSLSGVVIGADGLSRNSQPIQLFGSLLDGFDLESKMPQSVGFRIAGTFWAAFDDKEFQLSIAKLQIDFVILSLRTIVFANYLEAKKIDIKMFGGFIIASDYGDMMNCRKLQIVFPFNALLFA